LIGDGNPEEITVEADGQDPFTFDTNIGIIRNFTIRQNGREDSDYGIFIKQGHLELGNCHITSVGGIGVNVANNADPRIRRNRIHHCGGAGIMVSGANGTIESNELVANRTGIRIRGASTPSIRGNRVYENKQDGIGIYRGARPICEDNEIFKNGNIGVVNLDSDPIIRRNRIFECHFGFFAYEKARGSVEDNDIRGHQGSGIYLKTGASPVFRGNRIHNNKGYGVFVYEAGKGTFEDNEIAENERAGMLVQENGSPTVIGNRIIKNGYEAIWIKETGRGVFTNNDLTNNLRGPWDVHDEAKDKIERKNNTEN
jgi:F-box protein 11